VTGTKRRARRFCPVSEKKPGWRRVSSIYQALGGGTVIGGHPGRRSKQRRRKREDSGGYRPRKRCLHRPNPAKKRKWKIAGSTPGCAKKRADPCGARETLHSGKTSREVKRQQKKKRSESPRRKKKSLLWVPRARKTVKQLRKSVAGCRPGKEGADLRCHHGFHRQGAPGKNIMVGHRRRGNTRTETKGTLTREGGYNEVAGHTEALKKPGCGGKDVRNRPQEGGGRTWFAKQKKKKT